MALRLINQAQAQLELCEPQQIQAKGIAHKLRKMQKNCQNQKTWLEHVERLDTKLEISSVLSELSYCVSPDVNVIYLDVIARAQGTGPSLTYPYSPVVYECILEGQTANPTGVGQVVEAMEASSFFSRVQLKWLRQSESENIICFQLCADLDNGLVRALPTQRADG